MYALIPFGVWQVSGNLPYANKTLYRPKFGRMFLVNCWPCCREKLVLSTVCEDLLDLCCERTVSK
jgi:hypothetical protein